MPSIGLWHIENGGPSKARRSDIDLEAYLESWIERDPSLLQEGLTILNRQMTVEGGRLDLLALDIQGRWTVIEVKAGYLYRETVAQALDYASCIATLPYDELTQSVNAYLGLSPLNDGQTLEEILTERQVLESSQETPRDVQVFIVGTGKGSGLERMVNYLAENYRVPITVVTYEVFQTNAGQRILVRELLETELQPPVRVSSHPELTVESLLARARQNGVGQAFDLLLDAAKRHNLYPKLWKSSIMFAPPANKTRCLFTVWTQPARDGRAKVYSATEAFAEFYPVPEELVIEHLGLSGGRTMAIHDTKDYVSGLDSLFAYIYGKQSHQDSIS